MSKKSKEENVLEIWAEIAEMTTMMKDASGKGERGIPAPDTGVAIPKQENLGSSSDVWSTLEAELNNLLETANGGSLVCDPEEQTGYSAVADVEAVTMVKSEPLEQKPTVILPQTSSVSTMNGISFSDAVGNSLTASNAGVSYIPAIKNECGDITIKTETMPQAFVKLEAGVISEINGTNYMLVDDFPSLIKQEIDIKPECLPQFETSSSVGTLPVPREAPVLENIKPSVEKLKKVLGDAYLEKKKEAESIQASKGTGELARRTPGEAKLKQKKVAECAQSTNTADNLNKPTSSALDGDAKLNKRKEADGTQSEKGTDELGVCGNAPGTDYTGSSQTDSNLENQEKRSQAMSPSNSSLKRGKKCAVLLHRLPELGGSGGAAAAVENMGDRKKRDKTMEVDGDTREHSPRQLGQLHNQSRSQSGNSCDSVGHSLKSRKQGSKHMKDVTSQENELTKESGGEVSNRKNKEESKSRHSAVAKGAMVSRGKSDSVKATRTVDKDLILGKERSMGEQGRGRVAKGAKVSGDKGDPVEATRTVDKDLGKERSRAEQERQVARGSKVSGDKGDSVEATRTVDKDLGKERSRAEQERQVARGAKVSGDKGDSVEATRTVDKDLGKERSMGEQGRGRVAKGAKVSGDKGDSEEATRTVDKDLGKERNGDGQGWERSSRKKCVSDAKSLEGDEERLKHDEAAEKRRYLVDREEGGFSDVSDDNDADVRMSDLTPPESDSEIEEIEDDTQRDLKVEDYFQDSDFSSDDSDLGCPDIITIDDSVPTPEPLPVPAPDPVPVRVPAPDPVPMPASAPLAVTKPVKKERLVKRVRPPSSEDDSSEDDSDEDPWWGNELSSTKRSRIKRVNGGRKHQPPTKKMRSRKDLASVDIVEEEIIIVNAGGSRSYNCPFCMLNLPYRTANNFMSHIDAKHSEINTDFKEKREKLLAILFPLNTENGRSREPERKNVEKEQISIESLKESDFMHLNDKGEKQYTCKFCKYTVPYQNLNTLMTHLHKVHKELTANLKRQISDMLFDAPQVQATSKQDEAVSTSSASKSGSTRPTCKSKQKKAKKGEASESVKLLPGAKRETLVRNGDGVYEFQCQFCPIPIKYKSANVLMSHIQAKHKNIVQNKATMALMKKDMYDNPNLEMELSCGNMNVQRVAKKPLVPPPVLVKKPIQEKPVIEVGKDGKKMYRCKYCVISLVYHSPNVLMTHLGKKHQDIKDTPEHVHLLKYIYNGEFHDNDFETFCKKEDRKAGKGTSKDGEAKSKEKKKKQRSDGDDESNDDDRRNVKERRKDKKEERKKETGEGPVNRDREQESDQGTTKKGKATKNGKHFVKKSSSGKDSRKENGSGGKDGGRDSHSGGKDGRSGRSGGSKDRQKDSIHLGKEGQRHSSSGGKDGRKDSSNRGKDSTRGSGDLRQQKDKMTVNRHLKKKGIEAKCRECGKVFTDGKLYRAHILTHF